MSPNNKRTTGRQPSDRTATADAPGADQPQQPQQPQQQDAAHPPNPARGGTRRSRRVQVETTAAAARG